MLDCTDVAREVLQLDFDKGDVLIQRVLQCVQDNTTHYECIDPYILFNFNERMMESFGNNGENEILALQSITTAIVATNMFHKYCGILGPLHLSNVVVDAIEKCVQAAKGYCDKANASKEQGTKPLSKFTQPVGDL